MNKYDAVKKIKELSDFLGNLTKDAVIVGVDYYDTKVVESIADTMVGTADTITGLCKYLSAQAIEDRTRDRLVGIPVRPGPGSREMFDNVDPKSLRDDELELLVKTLQGFMDARRKTSE